VETCHQYKYLRYKSLYELAHGRCILDILFASYIDLK